MTLLPGGVRRIGGTSGSQRTSGSTSRSARSARSHAAPIATTFRHSIAELGGRNGAVGRDRGRRRTADAAAQHPGSGRPARGVWS
jgi:hypothetical protein